MLLSSENFYDDFGEEGLGEPGSNDGSNMSSLQSRMGQVKEAEAAYEGKIARNWRRGNWGVRGFALDKSSSTDTPVLVSVVAAPSSSSSGEDISLPQDRALPEDRVVILVPFAPASFTGSVKVVAAAHVREFDSSAGEVSKVIANWGVGAAEMLAHEDAAGR